ncbi:MAG TPA: S8 family peptidase [Niabella sp.]|jgi:subtilisin family serine protease|nr:S8 family peptidase [Chitinophagaceae bacterium]HRN47939.1 S8 family peptidase [Niabella sp.]HRO85753.1 S8 family peptidase [Niabella sp.]
MKLFKISFLFTIVLFSSLSAFAQDTLPHGWHLKDLKADGYYGISMDKAYEFVKQKKLKSRPVIVGIIDSGIDTTHEDLKSVLWVNEKEIPANGMDDDNNGYKDDMHGWNFLGSNDGSKNVEKDSFEGARYYWSQKTKYEGKTAAEIPADEKYEYETWVRAKDELMKEGGNQDENNFLLRMADFMRRGDIIIKKDLKKEEYSCTDLKDYKPTNILATQLREVLMATCRENDNQEITNKMLLDEIQKDVDKINNTKEAPKNYRGEIVNDNENDINDRFYGNNNLYVSKDGAMHGTHVAGIIGADRNNGKGMDGVADNVKLMSLRAVPDGDEHDKDIALAIRYAADNGARVINMSFGKSFSPEKKWVDDAVKYAESKGVLMVHAAGNDAKNVDTTYNFPSAYYLDGTRPVNWITVGASGDEKAKGLVAPFSNYGKKEVDVFAPGMQIYSTVPGGNTYQNQQGTSMASPVVAGLAAFIMSYYPDLTAKQVKDIIMKTVSKPTKKVKQPGTDNDVLLSDISVSGGIVNAYEAIKLASITKPGATVQATKIVPAKKAVQKKPVKKAPAKKK